MSIRDVALEAAFLMIASGAMLGVWTAIMRPWKMMSELADGEASVTRGPDLPEAPQT